MAKPTIKCIINFSTGPGFGAVLVLDDSVNGILDQNVLGETNSPSLIVDVTDQVQLVSTSRGRNGLTEVFQSGTATVRIADELGYFNPENLASPYAGYILPLRKIQLIAVNNNNVPATEHPIFAGYITGYQYTQSQFVGEVNYTTLSAVDGFRLLQLAQITDVPGSTYGDLSGTRVNQILDVIEWPSSMRDVDAGLTQLLDDPGTPRTSLNALQNVTLSEFGAIYMGGEGNVYFQDRNVTAGSIAGTPTVFADDGSGIPYTNSLWVLDDTQVFNEATITRTGGTAQNAFDQTSIDTYFLHSYQQTGLLMTTDTEALDFARSFVASRKDTRVRCDAVTLDLFTNDYALGVEAGLELDFFDSVTVKQTQPGSSTLEQTLQVFAISHSISPRNWFVTLGTLEPILDAFILDSSIYGVLDNNALSY